MQMQEPLQGISPQLHPHVHLLSTHRYPALASLHPEKVAEWLLEAPKISRNTHPFYWTYLDRPVDGTILLIWQSMNMGGHEFASDGYIWAPNEQAFQIETQGGHMLEMYQQKTGFSPGEPVAAHARRRYRLHPSKFPNHQGPQPDQSLWIVHYAPSDPHDRMPPQHIPVDARQQNIMNTRQYLHQHGQIVQKDFMLHDRQNWPTIAFPRGPPRAPGMYASNMAPVRVPQQMAYPPQHAAPGPPAKRVRANPTPAQVAANNAMALENEDEEDTSRGDFFDHITACEVSMSRYKQNHEWMEEILSSPYAIHQIIPADLGLGVRGEIRALTDGIFDAPYDPEKDAVKNEYVGRLDPEKADQFRKRVTDGMAETNKEIEKMKAKHAKRLAKLRKGSLITSSEKVLRTAVDEPTDVGPEYWRLEGKIDEEDNEDDKAVVRTPAKVADIVAQVEASVGRHAAAVKELIRIQDGGYEEPAAIPSPPPVVRNTRISPPTSQNGSHNSSNQSGVLIGDADMDMNNSAAGLLDQYHGASSNATPGSSAFTPQPQLQAQSSINTPVLGLEHTPQAGHEQPDVSMSDGNHGPSTGDATGAGDWVVVPPGGVSPSASTANPQPALSTSLEQQIQGGTDTAAGAELTGNAGVDMDTPNLPDYQGSPNDFADLGDLDSAGDALAGYGDDGDMDLDMDVDGGMESAFGDAFHGVETGEGEADGGLGDL